MFSNLLSIFPSSNLSSLQVCFIANKGKQRTSKLHFSARLNTTLPDILDAKPSREAQMRVIGRMEKQIVLLDEQRQRERALYFSEIADSSKRGANLDQLNEAYARCGDISAVSSFHWGTLLLPPEQRRAIWSLYAWSRRADDIADGPSPSDVKARSLDEWLKRLVEVYEGHPHDMFDAALYHTLLRYPIDIQIFRDTISGMRLDLEKFRYENFDELYDYCYYVAGTIGLMGLPVLGIAPESEVSTERVCNNMLALAVANQLTNILRDVGEDARMGRIYLPQDELKRAGLSDEDIFRGEVTDKWRNFMRAQIQRAKMYFDEAEKGIGGVSSSGRPIVWAYSLTYRQILDAIEVNDFDNFTKRATLGTEAKLKTLHVACVKALTTQ